MHGNSRLSDASQRVEICQNLSRHMVITIGAHQRRGVIQRPECMKKARRVPLSSVPSLWRFQRVVASARPQRMSSLSLPSRSSGASLEPLSPGALAWGASPQPRAFRPRLPLPRAGALPSPRPPAPAFPFCHGGHRRLASSAVAAGFASASAGGGRGRGGRGRTAAPAAARSPGVWFGTGRAPAREPPVRPGAACPPATPRARCCDAGRRRWSPPRCATAAPDILGGPLPASPQR